MSFLIWLCTRMPWTLMEQTHYSFNDSLILAGALQGGCGLLYSEDFASRAANRFADHSEPV